MALGDLAAGNRFPWVLARAVLCVGVFFLALPESGFFCDRPNLSLQHSPSLVTTSLLSPVPHLACRCYQEPDQQGESAWTLCSCEAPKG